MRRTDGDCGQKVVALSACFHYAGSSLQLRYLRFRGGSRQAFNFDPNSMAGALDTLLGRQ